MLQTLVSLRSALKRTSHRSFSSMVLFIGRYINVSLARCVKLVILIFLSHVNSRNYYWLVKWVKKPTYVFSKTHETNTDCIMNRLLLLLSFFFLNTAFVWPFAPWHSKPHQLPRWVQKAIPTISSLAVGERMPGKEVKFLSLIMHFYEG